jgi:hypothetical protein
MKRSGLPAALAAVCALLVVAPTVPAKPAKYVHYDGAVDQARVDPYQKAPRIEFTVRYSKNKKGKRVPRSVPKLEVWNLWFRCEHPVPDSGDPSTIFFPNAINDSTSQVIVGVEFPVKRRMFSTIDMDGGTGIEVDGRLSALPEAVGTVRVFYTSQPGDDFQVGTCDSGPLDWSAQARRRPHNRAGFSEISAPARMLHP